MENVCKLHVKAKWKKKKNYNYGLPDKIRREFFQAVILLMNCMAAPTC